MAMSGSTTRRTRESRSIPATGVYMTSFGTEGSGHGQFKNPTGIAVCNDTIYVTDQGNERVQEFSLKGEWISQFGREGSGNGEFSSLSQIACEPIGDDVFVSEKNNNRVQEFNAKGSFIGAFSGSGETQLSTPIGVAVGSGGVIYASDYGNHRIEKWTPTYATSNPLPEPPSVGSSSVSTIEYGVPVSGSGAPHAMGTKEVKAWAQKDDPEYATAIFPPDEPMGWPAKDYTRATIAYMDSQARTVNVATPSGAIATSEYNEANDVTRTLSADNRATALKESCLSEKECKSAEVSELLDTKSRYAEEGTQLTETLGPQHTVKLVSGKGGKTEETLARSQAHYYYDEGAPGGETYDLETKAVDDAQTANGEEFDKRTTLTSYGGQKGLGWQLREPTSTTTDPTGLDITKTTEYNETTGSVIETKAPGGTSTNVPPPVFSSSFGSEGTSSGHFKSPVSDAVDSSGDVWVADEGNYRAQKFSSSGSVLGAYGSKGSGADQFGEAWGIAVNQTTGNVYVSDSSNNRIVELNSSGAFVEAIGWGVSDGKGEPEVCTSGCKAGIAGSGEGQFNFPIGVTVDSHGNLWIADDGNNRVDELSEAGAFITQFGKYGTGNGQFNELRGIAISEGEIYVVDHGNARVECSHQTARI